MIVVLAEELIILAIDGMLKDASFVSIAITP